jgi:hypothetical protein
MSTDDKLGPVVKRVRINIGALVGQDHSYGRWPATKDGRAVDHNMEFEAEWRGKWWECRADDFGRRTWLGECGGYGNGSMSVHSLDGVTLLDEAPTTSAET